MKLPLVVLALTCAALAVSPALVDAAPAGTSKPHAKPTTSAKGVPKPHPPKHAAPRNDDSDDGPWHVDKGSSDRVSGKIKQLVVSGNGRVVRVRVKESVGQKDVILDSGCPTKGQLKMADHPELVTAWQEGRKVEFFIQRTQDNQQRFCLLSVTV